MEKKSEPLGVYALVGKMPAMGESTESKVACYIKDWVRYYRTDTMQVGTEYYQLHPIGDMPWEVSSHTEFPKYVKTLKAQFQKDIAGLLGGNQESYKFYWIVVAQRDPEANGRRPAFQPPVYKEFVN